MNLLYYSTGKNGIDEELRKIIGASIPEGRTEIYRSIENLSWRLCQPTHNLGVAVIVTTSKEELLGVFSIRDLLNDLRIILILPDRDSNTIKKGQALYPRFISYADGHFNDVAAVLEKMVGGLS